MSSVKSFFISRTIRDISQITAALLVEFEWRGNIFHHLAVQYWYCMVVLLAVLFGCIGWKVQWVDWTTLAFVWLQTIWGILYRWSGNRRSKVPGCFLAEGGYRRMKRKISYLHSHSNEHERASLPGPEIWNLKLFSEKFGFLDVVTFRILVTLDKFFLGVRAVLGDGNWRN